MGGDRGTVPENIKNVPGLHTRRPEHSHRCSRKAFARVKERNSSTGHAQDTGHART